MNSRPRSIGLDVLRAVAILMVLVHHAIPYPRELSAWGFAAFMQVQEGGWPGVDLFFVLSGFLVGGLLFQEHRATGTLKVGRFLLRRGCKIYPPYWLFLVFIAAWRPRIGLPVEMGNVLPDLFFYQNYTPGLWGTNWSLGVEEHFYLLLPFTLLLLAADRGKSDQPFQRLPWLVLLIATCCIALRTVNAPRPFSTYSHLTPTHLRIDGLFFGTLLAWLHAYHHERFVGFSRRYRWPLLAAGVGAYLPPFLLPLENSIYLQVFGFTVQWLGAGALIGFVLGGTSLPGKAAHALAAIGRTSYATYLWHFLDRLAGLALPRRTARFSVELVRPELLLLRRQPRRGLSAHGFDRETVPALARLFGTRSTRVASAARTPLSN